MDDPFDIPAQLPGPRDPEPAKLRSDITDELSDHLRCAMRRELHRHPDETQARRAMLERFGNPARLARKLYFDAMKEVVMKDRIMIVFLSVITLVCLASVALSWQAMQQGRELNVALLEKLETLGTGGAASLEWAEVEIAVQVAGDEAKPAEKVYVGLTGNAFGPSESLLLQGETDESGNAKFGPIRPGQYIIEVKTPWGLTGLKRIIVAPGAKQKIQIACPPPNQEETQVQWSVDWPQDLKDKEIFVEIRLREVLPRLDDINWRFHNNLQFASRESLNFENRPPGPQSRKQIFQNVMLQQDGLILKTNTRSLGPGLVRWFSEEYSELSSIPSGHFLADFVGQATETSTMTTGEYEILEIAVFRATGKKHEDRGLFQVLFSTHDGRFYHESPPIRVQLNGHKQEITLKDEVWQRVRDALNSGDQNGPSNPQVQF